MFRQAITLLSIFALGHCFSKKSGYCPTLEPHVAGICMDRCDFIGKGDDDCPENLKCCSNGCGHTCQQPSDKQEALHSLNVTVAFDIAYTTVMADEAGFIQATKNALENGFPQFFTFDPENVTVTEIASAKDGTVTKLSMVIVQGEQSDHDFMVYGGELKNTIDVVGQFMVDFGGNTIPQSHSHSTFVYVWKSVADKGSGQAVTASILLMALLALFYVL